MTASPQIEDESFKYSGYWKACADEVIEGDGVRFSDSEPGVIIRSVEIDEHWVTFLVEDRAAHVASVFADAFARPIEGMSADPQPAVIRRIRTEPVWVRM